MAESTINKLIDIIAGDLNTGLVIAFIIFIFVMIPKLQEYLTVKKQILEKQETRRERESLENAQRMGEYDQMLRTISHAVINMNEIVANNTEAVTFQTQSNERILKQLDTMENNQRYHFEKLSKIESQTNVE